MADRLNELADSDILLSGLAYTSRTETLEDYLKDKARSLSVVLISSCFLKENLSSYRVYDKGVLKEERGIFNFRIKNYKWYNQPLVLLVFIINWISIGLVVLRLRKRFDLYIGVSHSFAFMGALLKKIGLVKSLAYYCIDYYIPDPKFNFNSLFVRLISFIDIFIVKSSDHVWHISPKIAETRYRLTRLSPRAYRYAVVPLTYAAKLQRSRPLDQIERYTIGFVGTLSDNQGLQLLIKAMPDIVKEVPKALVKIIGKGPYELELKKMVKDAGLDDRFIFLGFIRDEEEVLEILSKCAIGIAPWTCSKEDNIVCADPGKPKLYALCGLPTVVTNGALVAEEISRRKAGISIKYDRAELAGAVITLLKDEEKLRAYKNNASDLARDYTTEKIFSRIFSLTE